MNTETEAEDEDRYATQGQKKEEKMSKLLWHQRTQYVSMNVMEGMLDHAEEGINLTANTRLNYIEELANRVSRDAAIVSEINTSQTTGIISVGRQGSRKASG